jgi:predicted ABC-type ATPase
VDDTKAVEGLTHELELTRLEMAALTDALNRLSNIMTETTESTTHLAAIIESAQRRGFWQRLVG